MAIKKSAVDERVERGEVYISPNRGPRHAGQICGAHTRNNHENNGGFCQLEAGHGTDHKGVGRCRFHGGLTPRNHGRYSKILKDKKLSDIYEKHLNDPDPLDLIPDLAAARALFEGFVEQYDEVIEALLAWHQNFKYGVDVGKPSKIPDIDEARKMLDTIAGIVSKIEKIRSEGAISRVDFIRIMTEFGRALDMFVESKEEKDAVKNAWMQIRIV
jgi:hypothetical protein